MQGYYGTKWSLRLYNKLVKKDTSSHEVRDLGWIDHNKTLWDLNLEAYFTGNDTFCY